MLSKVIDHDTLLIYTALVVAWLITTMAFRRQNASPRQIGMMSALYFGMFMLELGYDIATSADAFNPATPRYLSAVLIAVIFAITGWHTIKRRQILMFAFLASSMALIFISVLFNAPPGSMTVYAGLLGLIMSVLLGMRAIAWNRHK